MGSGQNMPGEGSGRNKALTEAEKKQKDVTKGEWEKGGGHGAFGKKERTKFIEKIVGPGKGKYGHDVKPGGNGNGNGDDAAIKAARVAAIKKANLSNKKYNVTGSTVGVSPTSASPVSGILYGGGGGGGYTYGDETGGGFSLSDIPSIVWIVLAVGVGFFLFKSAGKGKSGKIGIPKKFKIQNGVIK